MASKRFSRNQNGGLSHLLVMVGERMTARADGMEFAHTARECTRPLPRHSCDSLGPSYTDAEGRRPWTKDYAPRSGC
jgi:hypothetical protein